MVPTVVVVAAAVVVVATVVVVVAAPVVVVAAAVVVVTARVVVVVPRVVVDAGLLVEEPVVEVNAVVEVDPALGASPPQAVREAASDRAANPRMAMCPDPMAE
ncbi:MAG: hypothetical protein WEE36_01060 [Acidimicrobiia bacterium]